MSKRSLRESGWEDDPDDLLCNSKRQKVHMAQNNAKTNTLCYSIKPTWSVTKCYNNFIEFSQEENDKIEYFYQENKRKNNNNATINNLKIKKNDIVYEFCRRKSKPDKIKCLMPKRLNLQRFEVIQLTNVEDNNIITNLKKELLNLRKKSNISEYIGRWCSDICPFILYDLNGIITTEKDIINSLKQCPLVCHMNCDVNTLSIIASFVYNDKQLLTSEIEQIISYAFENYIGFDFFDDELQHEPCMFDNRQPWGRTVFDKIYNYIKEQGSHKRFGCKTHWEIQQFNNSKMSWKYTAKCDECENIFSLSYIKNVFAEYANAAANYGTTDSDSDSNSASSSDSEDADGSINESTFEFVEYMINNLYDCHYIELIDHDSEPSYNLLIGKTKTNKYHLAGYLITINGQR